MSNSDPSAIVLHGIAGIGGLYTRFDLIGEKRFAQGSPFAKLIRGTWFAKVEVMSEPVISQRVMSERSHEPKHVQIRELLDSLYRVDSGRILATLIRPLGDCDLAEEAMHEAFAAALSLWPKSGVPGNPRPWLISTARFKAIDTLRRRARLERITLDASQELAADCCALPSIGTNLAFAGCRAQSCRGHRHVRWSRGRSGAYRRGLGTFFWKTTRIGKLLPGAFCPCRYVPQARQDS